MIRRSAFILVGVLCALTSTQADATRHKAKHHHYYRIYPMAPAPYSQPLPYSNGRLVYHPAHNIACQTIDVATRALPCDHPVWVYGEPCEIDLGAGRKRACD